MFRTRYKISLSPRQETAIGVALGAATVIVSSILCYKIGRRVGYENGLNTSTGPAFNEARDRGYQAGLNLADTVIWNDGYLHGSGIVPMSGSIEDVRATGLSRIKDGTSMAPQMGASFIDRTWQEPAREVPVGVQIHV